MNDVIWYSRFAVLVGALVLLVQAVAGRAQGLVTVVAVLLLCIGFLVFIGSLAFQGWSSSLAPETTETTETTEVETREVVEADETVETSGVIEPDEIGATAEPVEVEE